MGRMKKTVEVIPDVIKPSTYLSYLNPDGSLTNRALKQLAAPFAVEDIKWKPTDVKSNKCIALCYADKRVYEERLDTVFGPQNWTVDIVSYASPYRKVKKAKYKKYNDPTSDLISPEEVIEGHKVFAIVTVSITGIGHKTSSSDSETDDENSIMTAEAQAFKRACSMYGIGKYLYDLPRSECDYSYGKITNVPSLPDWAIPTLVCEDCDNNIKTTEFKGKNDTIQAWNPTEIVKRSQAHFSKDLCMDCMRKRREQTVPKDVDKKIETETGDNQ